MKQPYDIVKVLYGSETEFRNCPAFCKLHHKHLTVRQIKQKGCLGKQCKYLDKFLSNKYWEYREKRKQLKKGGAYDSKRTD